MIRIIRRYFFLLLFCFCCNNLSAQSTTQKTIDSLYAVLKTQKEDTNRINTLNDLAWNLSTVGESTKGREIAETALKLSDKLDYKSGKANALNLLGLFDWGGGNYQEAIDKFRTCVTINEEIGSKTSLGNNHINIGNIYWSQGNYPDAIKYYKLAMKVYEEAGYTLGMVTANNNLGSTFEKLGNYSEALKYLLAALKISQKTDEKINVANCYLNIGGIYLAMMNYSEALKNYQTSSAIYREIGHKDGIAGSYRSIGEVYEKKGNYTDALNNYSSSLKVFIELGLKDLTASVYNNIGSVHLHQSEYSEALFNFKSAAKILEQLGSKEPLASSYISIGETLSKQAALEKDKSISNRKNSEAIGFLNKGLSIAQDIGAKEKIKDAYRVLSDIYKGMNDYKKALDFNTLYVAMKDSLLNNETTQKLEQVRTQYEVEKAVASEKEQREKLLAEQKLISEKALAERKRKNDLLLTGLCILVIVSVFSILLIRQRNLKTRAVERADTLHKMAEVEMKALRAQMNPHFIFNSLNSINKYIVAKDEDAASDYLTRFSNLIRLVLDNSMHKEVALDKDIETLELYMQMEQLRFEEPFEYEIAIDKNLDTETVLIPPLLLQPFVENSIWHGLMPKESAGKILIKINSTDHTLNCMVEDNGIGRMKAAEIAATKKSVHQSLGMKVTEERIEILKQQKNTDSKFIITDLKDAVGNATGTRVEISIPLEYSF